MTMAGERIMETHRLENRRFKRARMVVAVKISHPESDGNSGQLVHTLDLGTSGAKLGGLREEIIVGKIVVLTGSTRKLFAKSYGPATKSESYTSAFNCLRLIRTSGDSILPKKTSLHVASSTPNSRCC